MLAVTIVICVMIVAQAPTWAWLGTGLALLAVLFQQWRTNAKLDA